MHSIDEYTTVSDEDSSGLNVCIALSGAGEKVNAFARSPDAKIHRVECISDGVGEGSAGIDADVLMSIHCSVHGECTCTPGCGRLQTRSRDPPL